MSIITFYTVILISTTKSIIIRSKVQIMKSLSRSYSVKTEGADGTEGSSDVFHNFDETVEQ